jgi:hypothetical protein
MIMPQRHVFKVSAENKKIKNKKLVEVVCAADKNE